tara:strand:+ start:1187 stop:1759 length:573 start_codon:yes stop_codon:yes gene_type:complete
LELQIHGRNVEISDGVRKHVTEKLGRIGRHLPGITRAEVELASEPTRSQRDRVVAQVTLDVSGSILRAEQRASNTESAINSVAEALARRIERYKSRTYRSERARQGASLGAQQAEDAAPQASPFEGEELSDGNLVRIKRFNMKPMTVDEAAFQMRLLGHHFFMFLNDESDQYNVLYQRDDDNFGLIQPSG